MADYLQILKEMRPVTLEEMDGVRLMNRIDTKFTASVRMLPLLLERMKSRYRVQVVGEEVVNHYATLYYDTEDVQMYVQHHNRKLCRQKVRVRHYFLTGQYVLEIKNKTNKGRTKKKRIVIDPDFFERVTEDERNVPFLKEKVWVDYTTLLPQVANDFKRISLVDNNFKERITIDFDIKFQNRQTGVESEMPNLMIIELKQDGSYYSYLRELLREFRIKPMGISKDCIGTVLTNDKVKRNRFNNKFRRLTNKILNN